MSIRGVVLANGQVLITDWSQKITPEVLALTFDQRSQQVVPMKDGLLTFNERGLAYYGGDSCPAPLVAMTEEVLRRMNCRVGPFVMDAHVALPGVDGLRLVDLNLFDGVGTHQLDVVEMNFREGGHNGPFYSAQVSGWDTEEQVLASLMGEPGPSRYLGARFEAIAVREVSLGEVWAVQDFKRHAESMGLSCRVSDHPSVSQQGRKLNRSEVAETILTTPATIELIGTAEQVRTGLNEFEDTVAPRERSVAPAHIPPQVAFG